MSYRNSFVTPDAEAVTPSDSTQVGYSGLYVGTTGDVAVTTHKGTVVTFKTVPAGQIIPVGVAKVMATNTTASNIVGFKTS